MLPGVWTVKLDSISINDNSTITSIKTNFLIFPTKTEEVYINEKLLLALTQRFYSFDKFCLINSNLRDKKYFSNSFEDVIEDCESSFWSTFYPDPKSDLDEFDENNADLEALLNLQNRL